MPVAIATGQGHPVPPVEPSRRRRGVQAGRGSPRDSRRQMVARVQKHVAECAVHLARRREKPQVVAIREDLSSAPSDAIHRACDASCDCLHPAAERTSIARLDDEMRVIALERIVHEPKPGSRAVRRKRPLDGADDRDRAERGDPGTNAQCDVRGQRRGEVLPRSVGQTSRRARLPPGSVSTPTPASRLRKGEIELARTPCHLDLAIYIARRIQST